MSTVPAVTTSRGLRQVIMREGESVDLVCSSTGVPAPFIYWQLRDRFTGFTRSDNRRPHTVEIFNSVNGLQTNVTPGIIESTLLVSGVQYPRHDGEYECIGLNYYSGQVHKHTISIRVHVYGMV